MTRWIGATGVYQRFASLRINDHTTIIYHNRILMMNEWAARKMEITSGWGRLSVRRVLNFGGRVRVRGQCTRGFCDIK